MDSWATIVLIVTFWFAGGYLGAITISDSCKANGTAVVPDGRIECRMIDEEQQ